MGLSSFGNSSLIPCEITLIFVARNEPGNAKQLAHRDSKATLLRRQNVIAAVPDGKLFR
jgi:hypothetical protein